MPWFISATFRDRLAERDQLNYVVFPALAERLNARRCLAEIERGRPGARALMNPG
jgi:hypothetical protein